MRPFSPTVDIGWPGAITPFQSLKRECGHLACMVVGPIRPSTCVFQSLKRECGHLACCGCSVAWEAKKGKHFREAPFLSDMPSQKYPLVLVVFPLLLLLEASARRR